MKPSSRINRTYNGSRPFLDQKQSQLQSTTIIVAVCYAVVIISLVFLCNVDLDPCKRHFHFRQLWTIGLVNYKQTSGLQRCKLTSSSEFRPSLSLLSLSFCQGSQ
jgi:hypothetical protein